MSPTSCRCSILLCKCDGRGGRCVPRHGRRHHSLTAVIGERRTFASRLGPRPFYWEFRSSLRATSPVCLRDHEVNLTERPRPLMSGRRRHTIAPMLFRLALAALLLAGCATSHTVMAPDGSQGHFIECPQNQSVCLDKAADLCPYGYEVLGADSRQGALVQNYGDTLIATPTYRGSLFVKCRAPQAQARPRPVCSPDYFLHQRAGQLVCVSRGEVPQAQAQGWTMVP